MPTQRLRLTKTDDREYRDRLSRLEQMGIPIGCSVEHRQEPDRFTLEQTEGEVASIYELSLDEVAVIVPAKMTILKSGILITDVEMMTPWEDYPLELWDPEENSNYQDVISGLSQLPPTVLNRWLTSAVPLRPRRAEGVIIAHGYISVPRDCRDGTLVTVKLSLRDERHNELSFDFGVQVDRSVLRKRERRQQKRREFARSARGTGLFEPKRGQPGDEKSVPHQANIQRPPEIAVGGLRTAAV
jgi:hypothetical protein